MSVRHEKGRWNVSLCVMGWKDVIPPRERFAVLGLTRHYLYTQKKLLVVRDLDAWRCNAHRGVALGRTTYVL